MRRFFEIFFCLFFIIPVFLFVLILSALILLVDNNPPFFFQRRVGKNKKEFTCIKLRTMRGGQKSTISKFGFFIRDHGWDELPQLWNVLVGQMSLVGPRPLVKEEVVEYENSNQGEVEKWKKRFELRPGISGWCQIHNHHFNRPSFSTRITEESVHNSKKEFVIVAYFTFRFFIFGGHERP